MEDGEEPINERPAVAMSAPVEKLVMLTAMRVVLHADEAPIVERVPEARIAGIAHTDEETFAALPRDRRDAGLGAQTVIISGRQEPRGLGKHRGGDDSPDSWQGPEDRHVTMPLGLPRGRSATTAARRSRWAVAGVGASPTSARTQDSSAAGHRESSCG